MGELLVRGTPTPAGKPPAKLVQQQTTLLVNFPKKSTGFQKAASVSPPDPTPVCGKKKTTTTTKQPAHLNASVVDDRFLEDRNEEVGPLANHVGLHARVLVEHPRRLTRLDC